MKLLIILPRFPYPTEKGDKLRAFNQIKELSGSFEIILFALSHINVRQSYFDIVKPYCSKIYIYKIRPVEVFLNLIGALFNGWPLQAGYYYSTSAQRQVNRIITEEQPQHIYCQLLRIAAYAMDKDIPKTIDYQDVFSKGMERRIPKANFFMKMIFRFEFLRLLKYESKVFDKFDNKTIISRPDRDYIPHPDKEQIVIIPNGVDQSYFKPMESSLITELVFTGNMGYPPNIDCAEYLVNEVLPLIHKKHPFVRLTLAGASPHARVRALASDKVIITGWVDDIRPYYAGAKIFMAPMQLGTGLQNKLLEAMAMRLPCITSTLCNSALGASEEKEILIGNNAQQVATQAIRLLENKDLAEAIAGNGYNFVKKNYTWQGATAKLTCLMQNKSINKINS